VIWSLVLAVAVGLSFGVGLVGLLVWIEDRDRRSV
jgi:uncharacterized protein involved in exopolysaccharide biosynthesis